MNRCETIGAVTFNCEVTPMDPNPNLYIIDDGTLDTVVACTACDWVGRFNPDTLSEEPENERISIAIEAATDTHDCSLPD